MSVAKLESSSCKFLELPVEIREQIYQYLFADAWLTVETHPYCVHRPGEHRSFWIFPPPGTQILLTCKHIYTEVSPIIADISTRLSMKGIDGIVLFTRYSTLARRRQIKHLRRVNINKIWQYTKYLKRFPNVETVHITSDMLCWANATEAQFRQLLYQDIIGCIQDNGGIDVIGDGLAGSHKKQGWKSLKVDVCFQFDIGSPDEYKRDAIMCTFDLINETLVKHWHTRTRVDFTHYPAKPINMLGHTSEIVEREYDLFVDDKEQATLRQRYARFLGHGVKGAPMLTFQKGKRELRSRTVDTVTPHAQK